jgi:IS6 family transposase
VWRYVYRAIDQHGQVIDVLLTVHRDAAARQFFTRALSHARPPALKDAEALRGMRTGRVSSSWAHAEHAAWADDVLDSRQDVRQGR